MIDLVTHIAESSSTHWFFILVLLIRVHLLEMWKRKDMQ